MKRLRNRTKEQTLVLYTIGWAITIAIPIYLLLTGRYAEGLFGLGGVLCLMTGVTDMTKYYRAKIAYLEARQ